MPSKTRELVQSLRPTIRLNGVKLFRFSENVFLALLLVAALGYGASLSSESQIAHPPLTIRASENQQNSLQLFYDDFAADKALNVDLWQVNGPAARSLEEKAVSPTLTFIGGGSACGLQTCPSGMGFGGVDSAGEIALIQTTHTFTPPFTAEGYVMATSAHGIPFGIIVTDGRGWWVHFFADFELSGISYNTPGMSSPERLLPHPSLNMWYSLTISIDAGGIASLTLSQQGEVLGYASLRMQSALPYYLMLEQYFNRVSGQGPNQAYWQWVNVTAPLSPATIVSTITSPVITHTATTTFSVIYTATSTVRSPTVPVSIWNIVIPAGGVIVTVILFRFWETEIHSTFDGLRKRIKKMFSEELNE